MLHKQMLWKSSKNLPEQEEESQMVKQPTRPKSEAEKCYRPLNFFVKFSNKDDMMINCLWRVCINLRF